MEVVCRVRNVGPEVVLLSMVQRVVVDILLATQKHLVQILVGVVSISNNLIDNGEGRFAIITARKAKSQTIPENRDGDSDEEDDGDEDDDGDDQADDGDEEEYSGEEGDDDVGPEANGEGGSEEDDDEDDDDDDDDDDDGDDEEDEDDEDEEDEDEDLPQPPAKKRK